MDDFDPSPRTSKRRRIANSKGAAPVPKSNTETLESTPSRSEHAGPISMTTRGNRHVEEDTNGSPRHGNRSGNADDEELPHARSSGRERKRPRRYSASPEPVKPKETSKSIPAPKPDKTVKLDKPQKPATPKSILTPSKKHKNGARKSVAFNSGEKDIAAQFGFKDIDNTETPNGLSVSDSAGTPSKKRGKQLKKVAAEALQDVNDAEDRQDDQQTQDPDLVFDQILEAQQWDSSIPPQEDDFKILEVNDEPSVLEMKGEILSRLISASSPSNDMIPVHLQSQYDSIHSLLTATITTGESNSLLVLGSRGSGKSHIINIALEDMKSKYTNDFHLVRLNGFFQTDDKLALREIWRQLGHEMNTEEGQNETVGSYADTMASLLSLLSHPDEYLDTTADDAHLEDMVPSTTLSKSIVFVLDEFDLFTTHPRQTLLYNLFDIAQSRKAPIAVIGCSTRMDVVECLEKRVKSRFSHRWVHLPNAKSLEGLEDTVKNALHANEEVDANGNRLSSKCSKTRKRWNEYIETTFVQSAPIQDYIKRVFYTTKSIPELFAMLYLSVAGLTLPAPGTRKAVLQTDLMLPLVPQLNDVLALLPTLQLSLLVAASRLDTIHNLATLNFNLVYDHYVDLIARSKLQQTASGAVAVGAGLRQWTLDMASAAWEDLGEWNLIVPAFGASGSGRDMNSANATGGEGANVRMWKVDVSLDDLTWALKRKAEAGGAAAGPVEVLQKWCREI